MGITSLREAVDATPDVRGCFREGLRAVSAHDRAKFAVNDPRKLGGSLDIDAATKAKYPNDSRWDYAVEYNGETYFVEIHNASTSEIDTMINKLSWLKQWLREKAPAIDGIKARKMTYNWVYTNNCSILPNSRQAKRAAQHGLKPKAKFVV